MKREAVNHTKMKRLCRRLDVPLWQGVGVLESLWHLTAREAPRGDIGKLSAEDIALGIDYRGDETKLLESLIAAGWIDLNDEFGMLVHDWDQHADDAVHLRLARSRAHFCTGRAPNLTRLGGEEKKRAHEFYTACAQNGHPCAPPEPKPEPEPEPEPLPEPVGRSEVTAEVRVQPPHNIPDSRPINEAIQIPEKSTSSRSPGNQAITNERINAMRNILHHAMQNPLPDRPPLVRKPPDREIVDRCLIAVNGADLNAVALLLRSKMQGYEMPEHGPRKYAWFETVLRSEFGSVGTPNSPVLDQAEAERIAHETDALLAAEGIGR